MHRTRVALCAVSLATALLGGAGSAAQAAPPAWVPGATLSPGAAPADQARAAINARRDSVAAWRCSEGSETVFRVAVRPAGGQWGASDALTHSGLAGTSSSIEVGIDDSGRAVAVWTEAQGSGTAVSSSTYSGGSWSASKALSPPNENASGAVIAVNRDGDAVAAWHSKIGASYVVRAATRVGAGGWSSVHTISSAPAADSYLPRAAIDAHGDAVVVWIENAGGNRVIAAPGGMPARRGPSRRCCRRRRATARRPQSRSTRPAMPPQSGTRRRATASRSSPRPPARRSAATGTCPRTLRSPARRAGPKSR